MKKEDVLHMRCLWSSLILCLFRVWFLLFFPSIVMSSLGVDIESLWCSFGELHQPVICSIFFQVVYLKWSMMGEYFCQHYPLINKDPLIYLMEEKMMTVSDTGDGFSRLITHWRKERRSCSRQRFLLDFFPLLFFSSEFDHPFSYH